MVTAYLNWTTDIVEYQNFQQERGDRFCVSGHIRPGEYTAYYANSLQEAEKVKQRLRKRGCHQIGILHPKEHNDE